MSNFPLSFGELKALNPKPFYFGLGFIKVRLDKHRSMNFYDPQLTATVGPEEVHDHRYDFTSTIIAGYLVNEIYAADIWFPSGIGAPNPAGHSHAAWDATCMEGEEERIIGYGTPEKTNTFMLTAGSIYTMHRDQFHSVASQGGCITGIYRKEIVKSFARVLRPVGEPAMCPYANKMPEDELMLRIERLMETLPR